MGLVFLKSDPRPMVPPPSTRAPGWSTLRATHLRHFGTCAACGATRWLEVHHIIPIAVDPDLELVPSNWITLCRSYSKGVNCHLFFGHFGNWSLYNVNVRMDAELFRLRLHSALTYAPGVGKGVAVPDLRPSPVHPLTVDPPSIYQRSPVDRSSLASLVDPSVDPTFDPAGG